MEDLKLRPAGTDRPAARSQLAVGVWLGILTAAMFGTSGVVAKPLLEAGWSAGAVVMVRLGGASLALTVPAVVMLRGRWGLLRANARMLALYGLLAVAGAQVGYFNAVSRLTVGVALLLEFLGLVLVVIWLWLRQGQKPRSWTVVGVVLAIAGLVGILDLGGGSSLDPIGVLWGLGAAVGLATFFVIAAKGDTGLPPIVLAWAGMLVGTVGLVAAGAVGLMPVRSGSATVTFFGASAHWLVPAAWLAVFAAAVSYGTGISASRRLGSKLSSFLGLTEVLFAVAFAWMVLGETLAPWQLMGGLLIVAGVAAVRYDEGRPARRPAIGGGPTVPAIAPVPVLARPRWAEPDEGTLDRS